METDLKKCIDTRADAGGFIKVTDSPLTTLSSEQKAVLNRKGNVLFNNGDIESARRIFVTTGYSDGLTRVGDEYMKKNRSIAALKLYLLAHNKQKTEPLFEKMAGLVSLLIRED